jgi:acyl-coenzyme A synthetase/AMP-(fatty) acid ligase
MPSTDTRVEWIRSDSLDDRAVAGEESFQDTEIDSEWILLTSGTTGPPKLVVHTLRSLSGAIEMPVASDSSVVWATFYDIRRYGGLQIFLRAALTGTSLVLKSREESIAAFTERAGAHGVTNMSGTPSHWRQCLMSGVANRVAPSYVRLSGEIADQSILDQLQLQYPHARIEHAFASTEAGVAFVVKDGMTGFPSDTVVTTPYVDMKVEDGTLRIRSHRMTTGYLNNSGQDLRDAAGYLDTGDSVELKDGRYYFTGRKDGTINVGGLKVHPEEVEEVINRHPDVAMSLVKAKRSPITGQIVIADVMLKSPRPSAVADGSLQRDILGICRDRLSPYKVPAVIHFVASIQVADTGKLIRNHA